MTSKIDKKIVGYSIKKDVQQDVEQDNKQDNQQDNTIKIIKRLDELDGKTYRIKPNEHAYYITINNFNGLPFEIFINTKDTQHQQFIIAITLTLSSLWRYGQDASHIIEEFKGIQDPNNSYWASIPGHKEGKKKLMPSLMAHIGYVIEHHCGLSTSHDVFHNDDTKLLNAQTDGVKYLKCPECKAEKAKLMDGCLVCLECNYSKCQ